jgi:aspartate kinase
MQVFKFGGASVKDAEAVKNIGVLLGKQSTKETVMVVSAMAKTTNALEEVCKSFINADADLASKVLSIKQMHLQIINDLFAESNTHLINEIENVFVELDWILEEPPHENSAFIYDQIVSLGEILSTKIIAAYLNYTGLPCIWVDARSYIQTDNNYQEGKVNWEETSALIQQDFPKLLSEKMIVTQGFIGGTSENFTTTLGREGSDYSAAIFAACLNAASVTIWKDVDGVLNADPKLFSNTEKFERLPYSEALEMTYYGATVIHPKTIKPLQNKLIPLFVKPFLDHAGTGTHIGQFDQITYSIPTIIVKKEQVLMSISSRDFSFISEQNLSNILGHFAKANIKINTMQNSAMTWTCCFDYHEEKLNQIIAVLKPDFKVYYNESLSLITLRHYNQASIDEISKNKEVLIEQRSRNTVQLVLR